MRVTLISKACVVGAYQKKLEAIAAHDDIDLTVVVPPRWRERRRTQELERAHTRGYDLIVAPIWMNGSFHTHLYPTLGALLRRTRPDLVHMDEEPYNLATWLALRAAGRVGARSVFFTWQNLNRRYPPPFCWMETDSYSRACGAIAGNDAARAVLHAKGYRGPVAVIPQFGIDPTLYTPGQRPITGPLRVGFAGRLVEEKGVLVLEQALRHLTVPWSWVLCGSGALGERLLANAHAGGYHERLTLLGQLPSEAMPAFYEQIDVLVLPSLTRHNWKEQFGRVLIEAMASGVPVIGSDSGEIPRVIGDAGLLVSENDADAIGKALTRLARDPALRRRLSQRGRERALAMYTHQQIADATVSFYRDLETPAT